MSVSWNYCFLCSSQLPLPKNRFLEHQLKGEHQVLLKHILNTQIDEGHYTDDNGGEAILASINNLKFDAVANVPSSSAEGQFNVVFCEGCDNYAEIVTSLYKQIRSIQTELNKTLGAVKRSVIANSQLFGNNLEVRKHYWKVKEWMNNQEQSGDRCEIGRQFFHVLQKFQDFVYENEDQKPYKHSLDIDISLETRPQIATSNSPDANEFENPPDDNKLHSENEPDSCSTSQSTEPTVVKVEGPPPSIPTLRSRKATKVLTIRSKSGQQEPSFVPLEEYPRRSNTRSTAIKTRKILNPKQATKKKKTSPKTSKSSPTKPEVSSAQKLARQRHRENCNSKSNTVQVVTSELGGKKKRIYICSVCSYKTKRQYEMEYHLRSHETDEKPFSCPDCPDTKFTHKQYFDLHLQLHSGMFKLKCDVCEEYIIPINMKSHLASHSSTIYDCSGCSRSFGTFIALVLHIRHHPGINIPCALCSNDNPSVPITSRLKLMAHLYEVHNFTQLLLTCDFPSCSKTFFDPGQKYVHVYSHKHKFICNKCSRSFNQQKLLNNHRCSVSISVKPNFEVLYRCSKCPKVFHAAAKLCKHLEIDHNVTDWFCEICGPDKKFNSGRGYQKHLAFHRGDEGGKRFKCDQCPKVFALNHRLMEHLKQHMGQKDFSCELCGFATHGKDLLKAHLKIHERNKDKPYACPFCPLTFDLRNIYEPHVRTHWDELPYKCDECSKSFRERRSLTSHKRCHTGARREYYHERKKIKDSQQTKV